MEREIDGERKLVAGTWQPPDFRLLPEHLEESRKALDVMLAPCGDAGVGDALMPLLLTQETPKTEGMSQQTLAGFYAAQSAEYARHLRGFPLDILKAACDAHVVGGSKFFPAVYELTQHATPALEKRKRQRERVGRLIEHAKRPAPAAAFVKEPQEVIWRASIWRGWKAHVEGGFLSDILWRSAQDSERKLAHIEQREPAEWAVLVETLLPPKPKAVGAKPLPGAHVLIDQARERYEPPPTSSLDTLAELDPISAPEEPPLPDEIPE